MSKLYSAGIAKQLTASGTVTTAGEAGLLLGYAIAHGDTSQSSVTFRDGGSGGTIRWVCSSVAGTASGDKTDTHTFNVPIAFSTDIYATLSGTDTAVCVEYVENDV